MNIGELCHRECSLPEQQLPGHYPTFVLTESKKYWYFTSISMKTLRKKQENTNLCKFLASGERNKESSLVVIKIPNYIQEANTKQNLIYIEKISMDLVQKNSQEVKNKHFQVKNNKKIVLIRIDKIDETKLCLLRWSTSYIYCEEKINEHFRNKLTCFCHELANCIGKKLVQGEKKEIQYFELVFGHNIENNSIYCLFVQNVKAKGEKTKYYETNFKCETDDYERLQVMEKEMFEGDREEEHDLKKLKYLKFMNRLVQKNFKEGKIERKIKKQEEKKDFQCCGCHNMIQIGEKDVQRKISRNHIPEIQYFRQVKMKEILDINSKYDLVSVCQVCYKQFLAIIKRKELKSKESMNSQKQKIPLNEPDFKDFPITFHSKPKRMLKKNNFLEKGEIPEKKYHLNVQKKTKNFIETTIQSRKYSANLTDLTLQKKKDKGQEFHSVRNDPSDSGKVSTQWSLLEALDEYNVEKDIKRKNRRRRVGNSLC